MNYGFCLLALLLALALPNARSASEVTWKQGAGFRSRSLQPESSHPAGFTRLDPGATGILFTNILQGDAFLTNAVAHNGSGVAVGDIDGDGWPDIYLCNLEGPNRLYRNLGGWRFAEVDLGEAACAKQFSTGAALADVNGDGNLDLLVNGIAAGTRLFLNQGGGKFQEALDSGLSRTASPTSMALADIDGDGDLDLYCTHYIDVMLLSDPTTQFAIGRREGRFYVAKVNDQSATTGRWKDRFEALADGSVRELPEVDGFYRNDGKGRFTAIQSEPGVFLDEKNQPRAPFRDWGLAVMFRDVNGDGAPDLYVCNDNVSPDRFWINTGKGAFRAIDSMALRHTSRSSMGVDFADLDRDGHDDFIVLDMLARQHAKRMTQLVKTREELTVRESSNARPQFNRNTLFFGRADGTFAEAALMAGVAATDWSWCPVFLDVDLDGYEDLLVTNGFEQDVLDKDADQQFRRARLSVPQLKRFRQMFPSFHTPNAAFRNRGDGSFEPMGERWGFAEVGVSYGMALGDLDNDGDLDIVVNNLNAAASVYRNDTGAPRIAVTLKGLAPNTAGIGARLKLLNASFSQSQEMMSGGRYMSSDEPIRTFAARTNGVGPLRLEVRWRNGDLSAITNVQPNHFYEIHQPAKGQPLAAEESRPAVAPIFVDVSGMIGHVYTEAPFDDWARQPPLPHRLSRLGPGVAWCDLNGDGWEDLIIPASAGEKGAVFINNSGTNFSRTNTVAAATSQGAVIGWPDGKGTRNVVVASSVAGPAVVPAGKSSPGPIASADIDGDGDLDLFVGGRFNAGRYPEPADSSIWINENGTLRRTSDGFESIGMVSGACFTDLNGDAEPDLILALQWGSIRVFENKKGHFIDATEKWGVAAQTGLWTGITAGDFDGDGRMDLAAGNWGRNSAYELNQPGPLQIYYEDWNGDGIIEMMEAWQMGEKLWPVRNESWFASAIPDLLQRFPTHAAYSEASVPEILGPRFAKSKKVEAANLRSGVFLNRGDHLEWMPFPREAQLSSGFSVNVGDYDSDGIEDIFLSQNFFGAETDLSRDDAGLGLWLRGDGTGKFRAVDGSESGVKVWGEQRGAALADFNHDGRVDLVVMQNGGETKLYANQRAERGLRITLQGTAANPDAVGAQMRVVYAGGRKGPIREVHAGSGYWSQDGATQVLGRAADPQAIWIRWPDGKEETVAIKNSEWDIHVQTHHAQR